MNTSDRLLTKVYLIAGEPSGDILGARLMAALKFELNGNVEFSGVGGPEMEGEGLISLFPMSDLAVMGIAEVLPRLPSLIRRINQTSQDILSVLPDALVTIDSPDFSLRVAKRLKRNKFPLIHYVAPSVWAWRPGRAAKIAKTLDHLLALLPFEPPYFEKEGLSCTFVGHPVVESAAKQADGHAFRKRHGFKRSDTIVVVLPGSRIGEVSRHLPIFEDSISILARTQPNLHIVVVTTGTVAPFVRETTSAWNIPTVVIDDISEKYHAMAAGNAALAASGTVALELAVTQTPSVIAYRFNFLSGWVAKILIKVRFANLINLILDREAIPERIQQRCRANILSKELDLLINSPEHADQQRQDYKLALKALYGNEEVGPARSAARAVITVINQNPH